MSFTEDELQAFNTILERRLSAHRRDMERAFDQRMNALRRDLDQRLATVQQEIVRSLTRQLSNQSNELNASLNQKLSTQHKEITQTMSQQAERSQQYNEGLMDRALAAQLLGIEQLISQRLSCKPLVSLACTQVPMNMFHLRVLRPLRCRPISPGKTWWMYLAGRWMHALLYSMSRSRQP